MVTLASSPVFLVSQQVFGVLDSPEYSGVTPGVYRPVINDGKDGQAHLVSDSSTADARHGSTPPATSSHPAGQIQVNTKVHRFSCRTSFRLGLPVITSL